MSGLHGTGVLITRPAHQSGELARLVEKAGGIPVLFPAIEISSTASASQLLSAFHALARPEFAIVISSNAAHYGKAVLAELIAQNVTLAAIGPATSKAMKHLGCRPGIVPASGFSSEALLAEDEFSDLTGQRVLILRGQDGRELLGDTLRQRGAIVDYLETYRRMLPQPSAGETGQVESLWAEGGIRFVVANSIETLDNLVKLLSQDGQRQLRASQLVTISARVARKAKQIGIAAPAILAASPDDQAILDCMQD